MKLPGRIRSNVETLGRHDIYGPIKAANAEAQATEAWGRAFDKAGKLLGELMDDQDDAKELLMLRERIMKDQQANAEIEAYLTETNVIDVMDPEVPEIIRNYGYEYLRKQQAPDDLSQVKTHEIMDGVIQAQYDASSKASLDYLKETKVAHKYLEAMTSQWTRGIDSTMTTKVVKRQNELKANAETLYQSHLNLLNEEAALEQINENIQNGVWTPDYGQEKLQALGPTIDYIAIDNSINDASEQWQLDQIEARVDTSRITPDQRLKVNNALRQRQTFIQGQDDRQQSRNYETGVSLLARGQLTRDWITKMSKSHQISGGAANTLLNALNKPSPLVSDIQIVDDLRGEIAQLRYPDEKTSVSERYKQLDDKLRAAYTGVSKFGEVPKALTGEDFATLQEELDKARDTALGKGGQQYSIGEKQIRALTGYTEFLSGLSGTFPQRAAYTDFTSALQSYMQFAGAEADPIQFIRENAERYAPATYEEEFNRRFIRKYPEFSGFHGADGIDAMGIMIEAKKKVQTNQMPAYKYKMIKDELMYKLRPDDPTANTGGLE